MHLPTIIPRPPYGALFLCCGVAMQLRTISCANCPSGKYYNGPYGYTKTLADYRYAASCRTCPAGHFTTSDDTQRSRRRRRGGTYPYAYVGCYVDSSNRAMPVHVGDNMLSGTGQQRAAQCASRCASYAYMAMQAGGSCYCGNSPGSRGTRPPLACDSDSTVGGYPDYADMCGTGLPQRQRRRTFPAWTNAVYRVTSARCLALLVSRPPVGTHFFWSLACALSHTCGYVCRPP
jgi:hypothetical protein